MNLAYDADATSFWQQAVDLYRAEAAQTTDAREAAELLVEAGEVLAEQLGAIDAAYAAFDAAQARAPEAVTPLLARARLARTQDDWTEAAECFRAALGRMKGTRRVPVLSALARICARNLGRPDEAVRLLQEAATLAPDQRDLLIRLEAARPATETAARREVLERRLAVTTSLAERGERLAELGGLIEATTPDRAARTFADAYAANPSCAAAVHGLIRTYVDLKRWAPLHRVLSTHAERITDDALRAEVYAVCGVIADAHLGRSGRALHDLAQAGDSTEVAYERALVRDRAGEGSVDWWAEHDDPVLAPVRAWHLATAGRARMDGPLGALIERRRALAGGDDEAAVKATASLVRQAEADEDGRVFQLAACDLAQWSTAPQDARPAALAAVALQQDRGRFPEGLLTLRAAGRTEADLETWREQISQVLQRGVAEPIAQALRQWRAMNDPAQLAPEHWIELAKDDPSNVGAVDMALQVADPATDLSAVLAGAVDAARSDTRKVRLLLAGAARAAARGDDAAARAQWRAILALDPLEVTARSELGRALDAAEDVTALLALAESELAHLPAGDARRRDAWLRRLRWLAGHPLEVSAAFTEALGELPDDWAIRLTARRHADVAADDLALQALLAGEPASPIAARIDGLERAGVSLDLGEIDTARAALDAVLADAPADVVGAWVRAQIALADGDIEQARVLTRQQLATARTTGLGRISAHRLTAQLPLAEARALMAERAAVDADAAWYMLSDAAAANDRAAIVERLVQLADLLGDATGAALRIEAGERATALGLPITQRQAIWEPVDDGPAGRGMQMRLALHHEADDQQAVVDTLLTLADAAEGLPRATALWRAGLEIEDVLPMEASRFYWRSIEAWPDEPMALLLSLRVGEDGAPMTGSERAQQLEAIAARLVHDGRAARILSAAASTREGQGELEHAEQDWLHAALRYPERDALAKRALALLADNDAARIALLEARVRRTTVPAARAEARHMLAREYIDVFGDREAAAQMFAEIVAANPDDLEARREYARLLIGLGRHAQAVEQYRTAAETISDTKERVALYTRIGELLARHLDDLPGAIEALRQAIGLVDPTGRAQEVLAEVYLRAGEGHRALLAYQRLERMVGDPMRRAHAQAGQVRALLSDGREADAAERLVRFLKANPFEPQLSALAQSMGVDIPEPEIEEAPAPAERNGIDLAELDRLSAALDETHARRSAASVAAAQASAEASAQLDDEAFDFLAAALAQVTGGPAKAEPDAVEEAADEAAADEAGDPEAEEAAIEADEVEEPAVEADELAIEEDAVEAAAIETDEIAIEEDAVEEAATEADEPAIEVEEAAIESDEPAVEVEEAAVEADEAAVEADEPAIEVEEAAVEADDDAVEEAAIEADEPAVEVEEAAVEADEPAIEVEEAAVEADEDAVEDAVEDAAIEADEPAIEVEEAAIEADEPAIEVEEAAVEVEEAAVEADEPAIEVEEAAVEADEPAIEAEEAAVEADEPAIEVEEPAIEADEADDASPVADLVPPELVADEPTVDISAPGVGEDEAERAADADVEAEGAAASSDGHPIAEIIQHMDAPTAHDPTHAALPAPPMGGDLDDFDDFDDFDELSSIELEDWELEEVEDDRAARPTPAKPPPVPPPPPMPVQPAGPISVSSDTLAALRDVHSELGEPAPAPRKPVPALRPEARSSIADLLARVDAVVEQDEPASGIDLSGFVSPEASVDGLTDALDLAPDESVELAPADGEAPQAAAESPEHEAPAPEALFGEEPTMDMPAEPAPDAPDEAVERAPEPSDAPVALAFDDSVDADFDDLDAGFDDGLEEGFADAFDPAISVEAAPSDADFAAVAGAPAETPREPAPAEGVAPPNPFEGDTATVVLDAVNLPEPQPTQPPAAPAPESAQPVEALPDPVDGPDVDGPDVEAPDDAAWAIEPAQDAGDGSVEAALSVEAAQIITDAPADAALSVEFDQIVDDVPLVVPGPSAWPAENVFASGEKTALIDAEQVDALRAESAVEAPAGDEPAGPSAEAMESVLDDDAPHPSLDGFFQQASAAPAPIQADIFAGDADASAVPGLPAPALMATADDLPPIAPQEADDNTADLGDELFAGIEPTEDPTGDFASSLFTDDDEEDTGSGARPLVDLASTAQASGEHGAEAADGEAGDALSAFSSLIGAAKDDFFGDGSVEMESLFDDDLHTGEPTHTSIDVDDDFAEAAPADDAPADDALAEAAFDELADAGEPREEEDSQAPTAAIMRAGRRARRTPTTTSPAAAISVERVDGAANLARSMAKHIKTDPAIRLSQALGAVHLRRNTDGQLDAATARARIERDPLDAEAWASLRVASRSPGSARWMADMRAWLDGRMHSGSLVAVTGRLPDALRDAMFPAVVPRPLIRLLRALRTRVPLALAQDERPGGLVVLEGGHGLTEVADRMAIALGCPMHDLMVDRLHPYTLGVVADAVPIACVGSALLDSVPKPGRGFAVGRCLAALAEGTLPAEVLDDRGFSGFLFAVFHLFALTGFKADTEAVRDALNWVRPVIDPSDARLEALVVETAESIDVSQLAAIRRGLVRAAHRLALALSDGLGGALEVVRLLDLDERPLSDLRESDREEFVRNNELARDLIQAAASEPCLAIRDWIMENR